MPIISGESELGPKGAVIYDITSGEARRPVLRPKATVDHLGRVNGQTFPETTGSAPVGEATRKVTIFKDHSLTYPTLCLQVFVQPDPSVRDDEAKFAKMFLRAGCRRAPSVLEADLVVFAGGSDVDPSLYGATKHNLTHFDRKRDDADMDLYLMCVEHGIPMFGVCRGAQFLHVMNGGKLFQHVDNHYGTHGIFDLKSKQRIEKISSVHHQMVMPNVDGGMEIIATCAVSQNRWVDPVDCRVGTGLDVEAFYYAETACLGVQGHPEYEGYNFFTKWCLDLINTYTQENPDLVYVGEGSNKNLRIRPELLAERNNVKPQLIMPIDRKGK